MAKQTFTAGQVLTATQVNGLQTNDFNQTVSTKTAAYTFVVGDRGTRVVLNDTTARTFTIDNSIFSAGDTIYVHNINTGVLTIAAGAGVTLNGADVLTVAQWQSGTIYFTSASSAIFFPTAKTVNSGCEVIAAPTAFTTAGTVNVNNVFTTTYRHIQVQIETTAVSTTLQILLRMRAAGTDNSASQYFMGMNGPNYAADTTLYGPRSNGATSFAITQNILRDNRIIQLDFVRAANALLTQVSGYSANPSDAEGFYVNGLHNVATAYDGFSLITSTGTITGSYSILGFR